MPSGVRGEPFIANRFFFEMGQDSISSLQEVSGLDFETDMSELQQASKGGRLSYIKTAGATPIKMGKITLKYAAFKGDPMLVWREKIITGKISENRKACSMTVYDHSGTEKLRFNFRNAWPSKLAFSSLTAKGNEPLSVTITLEHEGVEIKGYNAS